MITRTQIDTFFGGETIAMVGVSRNPKKFGNVAYQAVSGKNKYNVIPVNSGTDEIDGKKCYRDIASLPEGVHSIVLMTPKGQTAEALKHAVEKGIRNIWIQQHTDTPEALDLASKSGVNVIHGKCIIMFSEPVEGFHKFHRAIVKFFGGLPK